MNLFSSGTDKKSLHVFFKEYTLAGERDAGQIANVLLSDGNDAVKSLPPLDRIIFAARSSSSVPFIAARVK